MTKLLPSIRLSRASSAAVAVLLLFTLCTGTAFAAGIGGGAFSVVANGGSEVWYYDSEVAECFARGEQTPWNSNWLWATGGEFDGDLGTLSSLSIGGQVQTYDQAYGAGVTMTYSIDDGAVMDTIALTYDKQAGNHY